MDEVVANPTRKVGVQKNRTAANEAAVLFHAKRIATGSTEVAEG